MSLPVSHPVQTSALWHLGKHGKSVGGDTWNEEDVLIKPGLPVGRWAQLGSSPTAEGQRRGSGTLGFGSQVLSEL